jgi:hypothetical protein
MKTAILILLFIATPAAAAQNYSTPPVYFAPNGQAYTPSGIAGMVTLARPMYGSNGAYRPLPDMSPPLGRFSGARGPVNHANHRMYAPGHFPRSTAGRGTGGMGNVKPYVIPAEPKHATREQHDAWVSRLLELN